MIYFCILLMIQLVATENLVGHYEEVIRRGKEKVAKFHYPDNAEQYRPKNETIHDYGTFDFIIIGSGSTGSVVANRLTEIKNFNVLLIEAGSFASEFMQFPGLCGDVLLLNDYNWYYRTVPQKYVCLGNIDRVCPYSRGRGIGGSSLINGMVFSRGHRDSYDRMAALGNPGWAYNDVLPYFNKMEHFQKNVPWAHIDSYYHSEDGPVNVEYFPTNRFTTKLYIEAANQLGYQTIDYNGQYGLGVSFSQANVKSGRRWDVARAYIEPILNRKNFEISDNSFVTKILIDAHTKVTKGVEFSKNGVLYQAFASKEVILSAGTIGSAQILLNSGVGPKKHLEQVNVSFVHDLEVGSVFRDQPGVYGMFFETNHSDAEVEKDLQAMLQEFEKNYGLLTASGSDALLFAQLNETSTQPDLELELTYMDPTDTYKKIFYYSDETWNAIWNGTNASRVFTIQTILLYPKSTGTLRLKNNNPYDYPLIDPRQLSEDADIELLYKGVLLALQLIETDPFKSVDARFINRTLPACRNHPHSSKAYWFCYIRHTSNADNHIQGTNPMGPDPAHGAVVDSSCKVHGVGNLRVADASIFPFTVANHPNAPCMMIGEKVSDLIKQTHLNYYENVHNGA